MEKAIDLSKRNKNANISASQQLKTSSSDDSPKEKPLPDYSLERENPSSQPGILNLETLSPESAESISKSKLSDSSKADTFSITSKYSDSKTLNSGVATREQDNSYVIDISKKSKNATTSASQQLKTSFSDDSPKEKPLLNYSLGKENPSSQLRSFNFETLSPGSAESISNSKLNESPNISKLSDSSKAATFSIKIKYSDSKISNSDVATREKDNSSGEFKSLILKHKTALHQLENTDTRTAQQVSTESAKKTKMSKAKKSIKNNSYKEEHVSTHNKVCNLQTLISNKKTRDAGLFYSLLARQKISPESDSEVSDLQEKFKLLELGEVDSKFKSSKLDKKSKPSDSDRNTKSSEVDRKIKSSKLDRKTKSPETNKKVKPPRLIRKTNLSESKRKSKSSKSLKEIESSGELIISEFVRSLEEMKLPETKVTEERILDEKISASIQSKIQSSFSDDTNSNVEFYFNLFKQKETTSSAKESSDSGTLTPGSDDLEQKVILESSESVKVKSRLSEKSEKSKLFDSCRKSIPTEQSAESNLTEKSVKSKLPTSSTRTKLPYSPMKSEVPDQSMRSKSSDRSMRPKYSGQSVRSKSSDQSVRPKYSDQSVGPKFSDQSVGPKYPDQPVRPKYSDQSVRPKYSDRSVKSKLSELSVRLKLPDLPVSSTESDLSVKSKLLDQSVRSNQFSGCLTKSSSKSTFSDQSVKSYSDDLLEEPYEGEVSFNPDPKPSSQQCMADLRLKQFVISRRPNFLDLQEAAESVKVFMDEVSLLKKGYQDDVKDTKSQRRKYSSDWLKLIYCWDFVKEEINMLIETISVLYDSEKNILMTSEEFHEFMTQIVCVLEDIKKLISTCQNGLSKYKKFCSSHDMFLFLNHATTFEPHVISLFTKLRTESKQFTTFKKNENQ